MARPATGPRPPERQSVTRGYPESPGQDAGAALAVPYATVDLPLAVGASTGTAAAVAAASGGDGRAPRGRLRVLLIEDDPGDAFLVAELLAEVGAPIELAVAPTLAQARAGLAGVDCVLLDLGLPDAAGMQALRQLILQTDAAICVLTGLADESTGAAAVAIGAQDYLVKARVDGESLSRAIRYAVERRAAQQAEQALREIQLRQAESTRLERGLLPQPLINTKAVQLHTYYQPGRHRALLGGDFFDAVQTGPDRLAMLVGDVSGHGPQEAALGAQLRVAWRALTLAGVAGPALARALDGVLVSERRTDEVFATLATVTLDLPHRVAHVHSCGHPPPLLITDRRVRTIGGPPDIALGIAPALASQPSRLALPNRDWAILIYTDGLIEGRSGDDMLGVDGLVRMIGTYRAAGAPLSGLPKWLVSQAANGNGAALADDVAMLLLTRAGQS